MMYDNSRYGIEADGPMTFPEDALTFGHGDSAECHAEPPTCGCPEATAPEPEVPVWGPREGKTGPVHRGLDGDAHYGQSWCGKRAQFRHRVTTAPASEVTCSTCIRRVALGRPLAYGASR